MVDRARGNRILEELPATDRALVEASVETVALGPGDVVGSAGRRIRHAYFPRQGAISLFAATPGSTDVGVGVFGRTGMLGLELATGQPKSALSAESQGHGRADRIEAAAFVALLARSAGLRDAVLHYGCRLSWQMARNTACMSLHPAQRRLARWLLDVTSAPRSDRLSSTQAAIAIALGVRRAAVSHAAGSLQRQGLIRYLRGEVTILDRAGLAAVACRCSMPG